MSPLTDTPSWHALLAHREALAATPLDGFWQRDPARGDSLTFMCAGIAVDFSKQRAGAETLALLATLARDRDIPASIATLFAGEKVNVTEGRPALHMALRGDEHVSVDGKDVYPEIQSNRERMRVIAESVDSCTTTWNSSPTLALVGPSRLTAEPAPACVGGPG